MNYLICVAGKLTDAQTYKLSCVIGHAWYARMWKARILIPDDYDSMVVIRECDRYGLKYRAFGTTREPRNGVKPYVRVQGDRDAHMIGLADSCYFAGNGTLHLKELAERMGKNVFEVV